MLNWLMRPCGGGLYAGHSCGGMCEGHHPVPEPCSGLAAWLVLGRHGSTCEHAQRPAWLRPPPRAPPRQWMCAPLQQRKPPLLPLLSLWRPPAELPDPHWLPCSLPAPVQPILTYFSNRAAGAEPGTAENLDVISPSTPSHCGLESSHEGLRPPLKRPAFSPALPQSRVCHCWAREAPAGQTASGQKRFWLSQAAASCRSARRPLLAPRPPWHRAAL